MFQTLRNRLALSHTLPILVFVPLLGVMLLYQLERHYFFDNLAKELAVQGALIAASIPNDSPVWRDPVAATRMLKRFQAHIPARIELIDSHAIRLAANNTSDQRQSGQRQSGQPQIGQPQIGQPITEPLLRTALQGQVVWSVDRNIGSAENVIDVAVPVINPQGKVEGAIRLSQGLTDIQARIDAQRWAVLLTLLLGAVVSLAIGLVLAHSIGTTLLQLTDAVARFTPNRPPTIVPEVGPVEIKALAATINQMEARLYELERSRKLLLSGIVHELARPLGAIKAAAQTIAQSRDPALDQELAHGIDQHIDQLRLHLDDLALLGELELQGIRLERIPTDLAAIVYEQCALIAPYADHCGLRLDATGVTALPVISLDPKRVGQIIGNLLHNACKYTLAAGLVRVECELEEGTGQPWAVVRVQDNGPGIALAQQSRIFQIFYRSPEQRRIHQGMGIGLALARQLAEAHGGTLTVTSELGRGATFVLRLPAPFSISPPLAQEIL